MAEPPPASPGSAEGGAKVIDADLVEELGILAAAQNGEIVLSSETYDTEAAAWNGAFSAQGAAASTEAFRIETATDGAYYFTLRAANGEVVGVSEMYTSIASAASGLESVRSVFATVDLL